MKGPIYLHAGPSGPRCRLGTIVADQHGCTYGVSADYILSRTLDEHIYGSDGARLGRVRHDFTPSKKDDESASFFTLIGRFELAVDAVERFKEVLHLISKVRVHAGQRLNCTTANGTTIAFVVVGRGGEVAFRQSTEEARLRYYRDPIVMTLEGTGSEACPGHGDAGSLLLDDAGNAVALLLSGDGTRYYAAALADYMEHLRLKPVQQNLLPPPEMLDRERFNEIAAIAQAAVVNLFAALSEDRTFHRDPAGNDVPERLMRELADME